MISKRFMMTIVALLVLSSVAAQCGGETTVVEKVVTVEVEKIVTVEVEKEVVKEVTVEVQVEPEEAAPVAEATEAVETTEETAAPAAQEGSTLSIVQERGILNCGGNANVPGFGYLDPDTQEFTGFDIDFCRTVAAAVLGDAEAIEVRQLTAQERFPVLQSGEVDVLSRNTTWTISRDTSLGFNFVGVTFYDGQGMMVRKDSGVTSLDDLAGATICVQQGTTTEKNLADVMRSLGLDYEPVVSESAENARNAYDEGRCDGFTTDKSGLVSQQILLATPEDHVILDETMSKEPLGPLVRHGDDQWFDIVKWVTFGTIAAEEYGITSANVNEIAATTEDPVIRNLLGVEGELGQGVGLDDDFMINVIQQVGNYGEIYDRHLGPDTPFDLPRGQNTLYTEGGLMYAPPFR
ncbi:amino acid ABC transporter substrate-binding protein [Anaerolineales bacterium HSG25]|nr:amino acid ABC transporter substrate-binding protein [Anaerolineales bacterium HSG25]